MKEWKRLISAFNIYDEYDHTHVPHDVMAGIKAYHEIIFLEIQQKRLTNKDEGGGGYI